MGDMLRLTKAGLLGRYSVFLNLGVLFCQVIERHPAGSSVKRAALLPGGWGAWGRERRGKHIVRSHSERNQTGLIIGGGSLSVPRFLFNCLRNSKTVKMKGFA